MRRLSKGEELLLHLLFAYFPISISMLAWLFQYTYWNRIVCEFVVLASVPTWLQKRHVNHHRWFEFTQSLWYTVLCNNTVAKHTAPSQWMSGCGMNEWRLPIKSKSNPFTLSNKQPAGHSGPCSSSSIGTTTDLLTPDVQEEKKNKQQNRYHSKYVMTFPASFTEKWKNIGKMPLLHRAKWKEKSWSRTKMQCVRLTAPQALMEIGSAVLCKQPNETGQQKLLGGGKDVSSWWNQHFKKPWGNFGALLHSWLHLQTQTHMNGLTSSTTSFLILRYLVALRVNSLINS